MLPPTLNSEEPLNAPFGVRCFLTIDCGDIHIQAAKS